MTKADFKTYLPLAILSVAYIATFRNLQALTLMIIPVTVFVVLVLARVQASKILGATIISFLTLFAYIVWYGLGILDCGNSNNYFDLSGCDTSVTSGIAIATVFLLIANIGIVIYTLVKKSTK